MVKFSAMIMVVLTSTEIVRALVRHQFNSELSEEIKEAQVESIKLDPRVKDGKGQVVDRRFSTNFSYEAIFKN